MTEDELAIVVAQDERVKKINEKSAMYVQDLLEQLEKEEVDPDDLLAITYGSLVTAILLGYSPEALLNDAKVAADNLSKIIEEDLAKIVE